MKRLLITILLAFPALLAQSPRMGRLDGQLSHSRQFRSGYGNVVFPGTGTPGPVRPFDRLPTFAEQLGATVRGNPWYLYQWPQGRAWTVVPYYVPVYPTYWGYNYPAVPAQITIVNSPPAPQVVIQQYYGETVQPPSTSSETAPVEGLRHYRAPVPQQPVVEPASRQPSAPAQASDQQPTIYLIALKTGTIYPALGYWTEQDRLHFITLRGEHQQIPIEQLDRPLTEKLNRERGLEFTLSGEP